MPLFKNSSLRHMVYELGGGYLIWPCVIMLMLSCMAVAFPLLEESNGFLRSLASDMKWLVPDDPSMAQLLLGAIAGSCITVVSVVYSVLLIALTFASIQFSPRILTHFLKDRICQLTLGIFIGTFAYCLILLPSIHHVTGKPVLPTLSLTIALALAACCLLFLIYFIHHIALAIQANYIVDTIAREAMSTLEFCFGKPLKGFPSAEVPIVEPSEGKPVASRRSGYIQFIDEERLMNLARVNDFTVYIHRGVGQFVPAGAAVVTLAPFHKATDDLVRQCLNCFHIGAVRSMEGDVEFGILQMVDIALKAISPAVNDPSTAISCIDHLSAILLRATMLEPPASRVFDANGVLRLTRRQTSFPRLLDVSFNQISLYSKNDMAVSLRLMRALHDISGVTNYRPYLSAIQRHAQSIAATRLDNFSKAESEELYDRLNRIEGRSRLSS